MRHDVAANLGHNDGSGNVARCASVPYVELPMPMGISRRQMLMQFRMGSHALPVEQSRLARTALAIPRHLRRCTLCETRALGDETYLVLTAPI